MMDDDLAEIRRLLTEAYEHYFAVGDGHCKSSEGAISIHYPPYFWRDDDYAAEGPSVEVYSYVLGPNRSHYFKNSGAALAHVREWHASEMARNYDENGDWY